MTTEEERRFAAEYLSLVRTGDVDSAVARLSEELRVENAPTELRQVAELLERYPPDSMTLIGVHVHTASDGRAVNLSWEYPSRGK